jgi:hypothetical protein
MSGARRCIAAGAIALSLSGCFSHLGLGVGALVANGRNSDPAVEQGYEPRTSVGKSMALGAGIGFVIDLGLAALTLGGQVGGGRFGH